MFESAWAERFLQNTAVKTLREANSWYFVAGMNGTWCISESTSREFGSVCLGRFPDKLAVKGNATRSHQV